MPGRSLPEKRRLETLAQRLHDELGPTLCALGLRLELLNTEPAEERPERLKEIRTLLNDCVEDVRSLSYLAEHNLPGRCGWRTALMQLPRWVPRGRPVEVHCSVDPATRPMPREAAALFDVARVAVEEVLAQSGACRISIVWAGNRKESRLSIAAEYEDGVSRTPSDYLKAAVLAAQGVGIRFEHLGSTKETKISAVTRSVCLTQTEPKQDISRREQRGKGCTTSSS